MSGDRRISEPTSTEDATGVYAGGVGVSIYCLLSIDQVPDRESFVLDIGEHPNAHRVSLFLDPAGNVCLRAIPSSGEQYLVRASRQDAGYRIGRPVILSVAAGQLGPDLFMRALVGDWHHAHTLHKETLSPGYSNAYVLGNSLAGDAGGFVSMMELLVYPRVLEPDEDRQTRWYLAGRIKENVRRKRVQFGGNHGLIAVGHPQPPAAPMLPPIYREDKE
jgi:hypothetical protein